MFALFSRFRCFRLNIEFALGNLTTQFLNLLWNKVRVEEGANKQWMQAKKGLSFLPSFGC